MIAPYDIMWNGKLYPAGKVIPATQKKLIASLAASPASSEPVDEPVADEPVDETPTATKVKK